jgi:hypothetical protein
MRKIYSLFLLIGLLAAAVSCIKDDEDPLDVFREIAYSALSLDEKSTVVSDWRQAEVAAWVDGNYLVIFESIDAGLADLKVVVDPNTGRVVEVLPRV